MGSAQRIKEVAALVRPRGVNIIVLSAMSGTTNTLVEIADYLHRHNVNGAKDTINRLEKKYSAVVDELYTTDEARARALEMLAGTFRHLRAFAHEGEFTEADEKDILAQGELMSTSLMHFYLQEQGVKSVWLPALDFMRIDADGEADVDFITMRLKPMLDSNADAELFVTQGFICRNSRGEIDNLQRGGSDLTASLIGAAIYAEEIEIWTDIDGMHNNDPREVSGTRPVKRLSFNEAEQLAFYGGKILHPFCIAPARLRNIPVRLLNSMEPSAEGTLISNLQDDNIIKAIAAKDHIIYIKFESNHNLCPYLCISKIFDIFAKYRTPLCLLVSSNLDVSVAIDDCTRLSNIISELRQYAHVLVEDRMTIVSVVGNMQWEYAGFEAKIMEALKDIPLRMISYGSSNNDVAFVIKNTDKKRALQALNDKLFQPEYAERN